MCSGRNGKLTPGDPFILQLSDELSSFSKNCCQGCILAGTGNEQQGTHFLVLQLLSRMYSRRNRKLTTGSVQFSSVHFKMVSMRLGCPYVLHPISQEFPQCCPSKSSNVGLIDDGPFSSSQGRLLSASSFYASLLQSIDCVMSMALCPQVASQAPQQFRSSETKAVCDGCFSHQSICSVISFDTGMSTGDQFSVAVVIRDVTGDPFSVAVVIRDATGDPFSVAVVRDATGDPFSVAVVIRDATGDPFSVAVVIRDATGDPFSVAVVVREMQQGTHTGM